MKKNSRSQKTKRKETENESPVFSAPNLALLGNPRTRKEKVVTVSGTRRISQAIVMVPDEFD